MSKAKKLKSRAKKFVDSLKLIDLVRGRPEIWDKRDPSFRNHLAKEVAWEEIGEACSVPVEQIRKKWKNLKDTYRKEYKKDNKEWAFYDSMSFIGNLFDSVNADEAATSTLSDGEQNEGVKKKKKKDQYYRLTRQEVDKLIELVKVREGIWDKDDRKHHQVKHLETMWAEISAELSISVPILKSKWKNLKDTLRKEITKSHSEWYLFEKMAFLIPQLAHYSFFPEDDEDVPENNEEDETYAISIDKYFEDEKASEESENETKPIVGHDHYSDEVINSDVQMLDVNPLEMASPSTKAPDMPDSYDEDVGFLNSLLPYMRKLNSEKKLALKIKIQELIYQSVYGKN